jgi:hypothetical protein
MPIRILEASEGPWGDYGDILRHGLSSHLEESPDGLLQLERTGPYVPPISFPGFEVVVTDGCRRQLDASGLTGFAFKPAHKVRIVDLPWLTWDLTADEPQEYPDSGEPEDYLLEREHSRELADAIGPLWQMVLSEAAETEREQADFRWDDRVYLKTHTWTGADIFRARGVGYVFVSDAAQDWLSQHFSEHVSFRDCPLR